MAGYLVTGGAGFIGSHVVDCLIREGQQVRVLDDLSTGKIENIASNLDNIEFIKGGVEDVCVVQKALEDVEYVVHEAAVASVVRCTEDPLRANEINVSGTLNVLTSALRAGVRRVVFASSSAVYGNDPRLPKMEDMSPQPISVYAVTKLAGECYSRVFAEIYGLETVCLRYFNVFGPRQDPASEYAAVIPKFIALMLRGSSPIVYGDGFQSRDFAYVEDVACATVQACRQPGLSGQTLNIACGESLTIIDLIRELNGILGVSFAPRLVAPREDDIRHSCGDISKARSLLGFEPKIDLREGLRRTVEYFTTCGV